MILATSPWTTGWAGVLGAVVGAPRPAPPVLAVVIVDVEPLDDAPALPAADACEAPARANSARPGNRKRATRN
jgi:hypothetical protein